MSFLLNPALLLASNALPSVRIQNFAETGEGAPSGTCTCIGSIPSPAQKKMTKLRNVRIFESCLRSVLIAAV